MSLNAASIRAGDRGTIARAISAIENGAPDARSLLDALVDGRGRAHVVGITGAPGAGKSTLIDALVLAHAARGSKVAVVAVDPSSPRTGGAVLGDRIRMGASGSDPRVFIRSLAARGHLGGVTRTTTQVIDLLDAAGFDTIIVETVGTGQSEVEIAGIVDTSVVTCAPGLGDDVQAIKAGILEIADVLVVTKGDMPLAERTARDLKDMLRLRAGPARQVPVLTTTAAQGGGIDALADAIVAHGVTHGRGRRLRTPASPSGDKAEDARARVARLHAADPFLEHCAIELVEAGEGQATLRMTVQAIHLNFNGACHGGALFALADSAFGLASNSHGVRAAGIDAHIAYHVAARDGDVLLARASEVSRGKRIATYRVDVDRADGTRIASFTGTVFRSEAA
jgi:LAO/AO transport system ATPase/phenylacetic acid degradation protein PaaD